MDIANHHTLDLANNAAKNLVIFVHGYGANGRDLLSLAPEFNKFVKDGIYVAPDAPNINPFYPDSYFWFPLESFAPDYLEDKVNQAVPTLEKFIKQQQAKYNLSNKDTYLIGFSQGSMLALHTGLQQDEAFKLIVSFSGGCLPNPKENYIKNHTPVIFTHGKKDEVLPWEYTANSVAFLAKHNLKAQVKYLEYDEHYISKEAINAVRNFT